MIKNIRIKNFKSLRDVSVDLEPITVLVGRGGSGKSNFVSAFAFLRDYLLTRHHAFARFGGVPKVLWNLARAQDSSRSPEIEFDVQFDMPGQIGSFRYNLSLNNAQIVRELLNQDDQPIFHREANKWLKEPALRPMQSGDAATLELASGINEVGQAFSILTAGIGCYDFNGDVLRAQVNRQSVRPQNEAGLGDNAENYLDCFEDIDRNLNTATARLEILASLRKLKPTLRSLRVAPVLKDHIVVTLDLGGTDVSLDLSQESEGFRRFLAHLIALYQIPSKVLMTFEEPEKGLYPGALAALAEQIKAFPSRAKGQIVLTTHNPVLLDHFSPEQIRVVELENLETKIGRLAQHQAAALHDQLATTGELLTVDPAQLASPAAT